MEHNKTLGVRSPESAALLKFWQKFTPGQQCTWGKMAAVVGHTLDTPDRRAVVYRTASAAPREIRMTIRPLADASGYKRLTDEEIAEETSRAPRRIRRIANRTIQQLNSIVSYDKLDPAQKIRVDTSYTVAALVQASTTKTARDRIEGAVRQISGRPDFGDTLKILGAK